MVILEYYVPQLWENISFSSSLQNVFISPIMLIKIDYSAAGSNYVGWKKPKDKMDIKGYIYFVLCLIC